MWRLIPSHTASRRKSGRKRLRKRPAHPVGRRSKLGLLGLLGLLKSRLLERSDGGREGQRHQVLCTNSDVQCESQHSTSKGREGWQEAAGGKRNDQWRNVPMLLCNCYRFRPTRWTSSGNTAWNNGEREKRAAQKRLRVSQSGNKANLLAVTRGAGWTLFLILDIV